MIPVQIFVASVGWLQHEQHEIILYLREENRVLKAQSATPEQLRGLVELAGADPDASFGDHIRYRLLDEHWIDDALFDEIAQSADAAGLGLGTRRARLLRQISRSPITDELVETCLRDGDRAVQMALAAHEGLAPHQLERLADTGASRKVRNVASARLGRRRGQRSS